MFCKAVLIYQQYAVCSVLERNVAWNLVHVRRMRLDGESEVARQVALAPKMPSGRTMAIVLVITLLVALLNVICTSGLRSKRFGFVAQTRTTSLLKTPFCEAVAHLVLED